MTDMTIPPWAEKELREYVDRGVIYSGFLTAVVQNDLSRAVAKADSGNQRIIANYVMWLHNMAPDACHGSVDAVREWHKAGGGIGLYGTSYYHLKEQKENANG